ncbi:MAG: hypothetical protein AAF417_18960 [Pseudomonadota bacterium]
MKAPRRTNTKSSLGIALAALIAATPAYAYLDPGTGSIILQGILASIAVAIGVVRAYWMRIKGFFTDPKAKPAQPRSEPESEPGSSAT